MNAKIINWIDKQKPKLVRAAEEYLSQNEIYRAIGSKKAISISQLQNLLNAARSGSTLAELRNFLRYQMGRGTKGTRGWTEWDSGEALIRLLDEQVGQRAEKAPPAKANQEGAPKTVRYDVESKLAALLLGYIVRHFTFMEALSKK